VESKRKRLCKSKISAIISEFTFPAEKPQLIGTKPEEINTEN
jgi:hypothetical protein